MNTDTPKIIVIIPHYNNPIGLLKSIQSIVETEIISVLVVDDGSKEKIVDEEELVNGIPKNINLSFTYFEENRGIEHALNWGLQYALDNNYEFIARLDCGDICAVDRFKNQKNFFLENTSIGIVGSHVKFFDIKGNDVFNLKLPLRDKEIRKKMFLNSMFIHPAIMIKREVLEKVSKYPIEFEAAEDYAFFFEILKHFEGANIDEFLVHCEINHMGISIKKRKQQIKSRIRLIIKNFDFSFYSFYGLFRNIALSFTPYKLVLFLKSYNK